MPRILKTGLFPTFPGSTADGVTLVALSQTGGNGKGVRSLKKIARDIVQRSGLAIASGIVARHTLRSVIARSLKVTNADSYANRVKNILDIVLRTGIDTTRLIEHGSPRVRDLGIVADAYRRALRSKKLIDQAELLRVAVEFGPEPRPLVVYGHHRARKEEVEFVDAIAADGSVMFLPCGDHPIFTSNTTLAEQLKANGWTADIESGSLPNALGEELGARFIGLDGDLPRFDAFAFSDIDAEVRRTLSVVKQLILDGCDPGQIAIIASDQEQYVPSVAAVADEYGLPIRIDHKVPLGSTGFGGFVRLLFDAAREGFRFEATARMIMHRFGPKMEPDMYAAARAKHPVGIEKWAEYCPAIAILDRPDEQTFDEWATWIKDVFNAFDVKKKAGADACELIAFNTFFETLAAAGQLEGGRSITFETLLGVISDILSSETAPFRSSKTGVALLSPDSIIGLTYDHIFVMGAAEGMLPKPPSEDPVVDFFERKQLSENGVNFASAAEVARWEEMSFYFTLLAARREFCLSYPKIVDGREMVASSFFARLGVDKVPPAPIQRTASSNEEYRAACLRESVEAGFDTVLTSARRQYDVERRRESNAPYDEFDGVTGIAVDKAKRGWSASQLTVIGQCPFRWFAERILGLKPLDEMDIGLDPSVRGKLYHKALEIAVGRAKDEADVRSATLQYLDDAFADAEISDEVGLPDLPNWEVERREHLNDLRKAISAEDFIKEGAHVVDTEQKFEAEWMGFRLTGSIDRVDDTSDGLIAVDYKTSGAVPKGAKDENAKLNVDVQIPLYANIALKALYPDGNYGNSLYYSLTKGKVLRTEQEGDMKKVEELGQRITELLETGSFPVDPDKDWGACTYCNFAGVCRKGPRLRRKSS